MLGSCINGASTVKGYFYLALAGVALAIISQYTSMQWAKHANDNYKPNYIFIDSSGSAYLVETPNKDQAVISEAAIRSSLWQVAKAQYEVVGDTFDRHANNLINYYLDGEALSSFRKNSDNPNILGTSAEKKALIKSACCRHIELRSMRLHNATALNNCAQKISAELMFYARTYGSNATEPRLRRAFSVHYVFTIMEPVKPALDLSAQRQFLTENPIRLSIQSFSLHDDNPGVEIPMVPENQSPQSSHQSRALVATGATPIVTASKTGGPVASTKSSLTY